MTGLAEQAISNVIEGWDHRLGSRFKIRRGFNGLGLYSVANATTS